MDEIELPLIIGFVRDIFFIVKIEAAATQLGFEVRWIESLDKLGSPGVGIYESHSAEPLTGPEAILFENLTRWKPALLIFDLNNSAVPWQVWINLITSVPATRNIPVICYGSHKEVQTLKAARAAGARAVVARSRFVSDLPGLIQQYARIINTDQLNIACRQPISATALLGLEAFNHGEFFEAHEYLEEAWKAEQNLGRELYQAVLQVAVAYLQIERQNFKGAMKMFLRMRQWIDPLPDVCRGVEIGTLRADARRVYDSLQALGAERIAEFDHSLFKPVSYQIE